MEQNFPAKLSTPRNDLLNSAICANSPVSLPRRFFGKRIKKNAPGQNNVTTEGWMGLGWEKFYISLAQISQKHFCDGWRHCGE
jgi:hypothetical protein